MAAKTRAPKTLLEAVKYFSDKDVALRFVADLKWPDGAVCPRCESKDVTFLKTRQLWKCKGCKKQFSVKVGTIFEDSPIGLDKWLPAMWQIVNCKNGISSYELARANFAPFPRARLVRGRVPATLATVDVSRVAYLSIDMNCAAPEVAALEHFWPRLVPGAAVVLDDYGWTGYSAQKAALDAWARGREAAILTLPTGQGLLLKP